MRRIKEFRIQNFKAFQKEEIFDFGKKGKNVLVYGNNGSGKSSFFWALYTLLQSSNKEDVGIKKYFEKYVASNPDTHQTLKNVFMDEDEGSFIKLTSIDTETGKEETYTISHDVINTNKNEDTIIQELNLASDFINYKLLHNFYRGSHKQEVNLWSVFERDIFPYFTDDTNKPYIVKWYSYFDKVHNKDGRSIGSKTHERKSIDTKIEEFDKELKKFISETQDNANSFLKEHFLNGEETIRITLDPRSTFSLKRIRNKMWKNEEWRKSAHQIILKVKVRKPDGEYKLIERPHSFLNESLLTRIAISIRIGALRTRPLKEAKFKSLVLDDMLISLDLSNRMDVVRIILNKENKGSLKFFDGFQKFILTHDKGFFNLIRRNTDEEEWVYYNFNKDESDNSPPKIKPDYTSLQKAVRYFEEDEFENCGNELRKEAEAILSSYLDPEMKLMNQKFKGLSQRLEDAFTKLNDKRLKDFKSAFGIEMELQKLRKIKTDFQADGTLSEEDKAKLEALKTRIFDFLLEFNEKKNQKELLVKDVKEILDRVMNSASHHGENPLYRTELKEAIEKMKELKKEFE